MTYTDTALEQFRTSFDKNNLAYDLGKVDEKEVNIIVKKNDISITAWFDAEKQIYGFNMIQGGCKTYPDFAQFENMFITYIGIHTIFLPHAKAIADVYEKALGINSVYDNFMGNQKSGYTAIFKVLGQQNTSVHVNKINEGYCARLVTTDELDSQKFKVVSEYKYEMDEVGNITLIPTIHSYLDKLNELYGESDTIDIERIGVDEFVFGIEDLTIRAKISFMYTNITYFVETINEEIAFSKEVILDDPYKLTDLYLEVKNFYDDYMAKQGFEGEAEETAETEEEAEAEEEVEVESEEEIETETESEEEVFEGEEEVEAEEDTEEIYSEPEVQQEEVATSEPEEDDNLMIKRVQDSDFVEVIDGSELYLISSEVVKSYGVVIERILDSVGYINRHGLCMTEDERNLHKFAKNISEDSDKCQEVIFKLFA